MDEGATHRLHARSLHTYKSRPRSCKFFYDTVRRHCQVVYRTRCSGHAVALCGAPEVGVEASGAHVAWAEVAILLDQPLSVVAGGEVADGVADLFDGLEDAAMDGLFVQR